jgi:hypothetical protein
LQRNIQVLEYLCRLSGKIALADDVAVAIKRSLAGDENDATAANLYDLRKPRRLAKFGRL